MVRTKPSSSVAGRIPFPSVLKSATDKSAPLKPTLISHPLPLTNSSNVKKENRHRGRTDSTETIRPKVAATRKRARVDSGLSESEGAPRTRQRLSSGTKPVEINTGIRVPSNYRLGGAPVLNIGRSTPAVPVLTPPETETVKASDSPTGFARKSPFITRTKYPPIPSKWDSNAFPIMKLGLMEYHNRFRDADLARPKRELSSRIIPEGLLPPPIIYEPEDEDDFDEKDILFHITPPLTDHWGNILEVSARHLEMSIALEDDQSFIEFWDLDDLGIVHVGVPAYIHFTLKVLDQEDASLLNRAIPPRPDFRCIHVSCESFEYHTKLSSQTTPQYSVKYRGATVGGSKQINPENGLISGIVIKRKWGKIFPSSDIPRKSTSLDGYSDASSGDEFSSVFKSKDDHHQKKGWFLKLWVPIPLDLFRRKESRAFRLKASAWLGDERSGGILSAETDMVLSHLRSHREME